ncbi:hypothetical protein N7E02_21090 [Aliirhizobium terrae]|uniref:hypothetical protein n=1 Tax=Terrirhizobium terrae TaxID=2926709 RepID=UPI002575B3D5|nr:hypothetical protein [Rhizobium sp. CC-CFT758]WJH39328.1 hypothetical protein N7E02_21090 [Rhizobium sp. CC-CFT758]
MTEGMLSDAKKEQIKLRATFLNNIGIGIMLIGVFTPIVRVMNDSTAAAGGLLPLVGSVVICFPFGIALHFAAGLILKGLNK